ncbi:MAG: hypothetical protein GXY78_08005 [Deltaproteobacteria bacterium]|nr:hypothetical protein [Deltaproteobacteria bacterium]
MRTLEETIRETDFVLLHVSHMKETHHLVGETQLALMKKAAFLINTSRGGIVDEAALFRAQGKEHRGGGAGRLREGAAASGFALLRTRERDGGPPHGGHDGPGARQHGRGRLPGDPGGR